MEAFLRFMLRCVLAAAALAASACMDVEQDLWVRADGSGRVKISMKISGDMLALIEATAEKGQDPFDAAATRKKLEADANVKTVKVTEKDGPDSKSLSYEVELKDITKLDALQKTIFEDRGGSETGDTTLTITGTETGSFYINAHLKSDTPEGEAPVDEGARKILKQLFGDAAFTFRVHGPPLKHNGKLNKDAAEWEIPLTDLASGKSLKIEAEITP